MSPAKPEIAHWGGGALPDKFGTSDNPQTREGKFVPVDQIPDTGLDPEQVLLAKEAGEIEETAEYPAYPEYNSPEAAVGSYDTERVARRRNEKTAGWSPKTRVARVESLTDHIDADRIQESHDKTITEIKQDIKGKTQIFGRRRAPRPDDYKDRRIGKIGGKKSNREIAA